ncbi:methyltransferase domain-containing protein [Thermodesulfobacteriota bacterium]
MATINRHYEEIQENLKAWREKPLLRKIYTHFHKIIAEQLPEQLEGNVVELGSGVADIRKVIPACIRTDLFDNPWIEHVENAYDLSFDNASISGLILFDVFHHLRYPGTALKEFHRVLVPEGRVIIFEPCISLFGILVYGLFHNEPLALNRPIEAFAPDRWSPKNIDYYAAQGNATRIFLHRKSDAALSGWRLMETKRLSAVSYVASGGYSGPQMYPKVAFPAMRLIDKFCDILPDIFATRLLIILEKPDNSASDTTKVTGKTSCRT